MYIVWSLLKIFSAVLAACEETKQKQQTKKPQISLTVTLKWFELR